MKIIFFGLLALAIITLTGCNDGTNTGYMEMHLNVPATGEVKDSMTIMKMKAVAPNSVTIQATRYDNEGIFTTISTWDNCSVLNNDNWTCKSIEMINGNLDISAEMKHDLSSIKGDTTFTMTPRSAPVFYIRVVWNHGIVAATKLYLKAH